MYQPNQQELKQLLGISTLLSSCADSSTLRHSVARPLLDLLRGDMLASFCWNDSKQAFEDVVSLNMSPSNLDKYQKYFQYCDPITSLLQQRRVATLVNEVMPQVELEKTEFYTDFLRVDGLKWGLNLYAYEGSLNIADLRVWRNPKQQPFGEREVVLLGWLNTSFTNSMIHAKSFYNTNVLSSGWHDLWEHHPNACLVFDVNQQLSHPNKHARSLLQSLAAHEHKSLLHHITLYLHEQRHHETWNGYRLSYAKRSEDKDSFFMVQLNRNVKPVVDRQWLLSHFALTIKEADICLWVMRGFSDKLIAEHACSSIWTVRAHIKNIFEKLQINGRSELMYLITSSVADIQVA